MKKIEVLGRAFVLILIMTCFLAAIVFSTGFAAAVNQQEKLALVSCSYSFNDENIGSWSSTDKKGEFLRITNANSDKSGEYGSYQYTNMKTPSSIPYSNEFQAGGNSQIPIIDLTTGENYLYTLCKYKSLSLGRTIISSYEVPSRTEFLTSDFGLTTGIVTPSTTSPGSLPADIGQMSNSPFSFTPQIISPQDNSLKIIRYKTGTGEEKTGEFYPQNLNIEINPGDEIEILTRTDLSPLQISGLVSSGIKINENGGVALFISDLYSAAKTIPKVLFYVKSPLDIASQRNLINRALMFKVTSLKLEYKNSDHYEDLFSSDGTQQLHYLTTGDKLRATFTLHNPYGIPLENKKISYMLHGWSSLGVGYSAEPKPKTDLCCNNFAYGRTQIAVSTIQPGGDAEIKIDFDYYNQDAFNSYISPLFYADFIDTSTGTEVASGNYYGPWLYDGFPYIGIGGLSPTLGLYAFPDGTKPAFIFKMSLSLIAPTSTSSSPQNDYSYTINIYEKGTNTKVFSETNPLPGTNTYRNLASPIEYTIPIAINDPNIFTPGKDYTFELFLVYNGDPINNKDLRGKKISTLTTYPSLASGVPFSVKNEFKIGPSSWPNKLSGTNDVFYIQNPTFYTNDLTLSIDRIDWAASISDNFKKHVYLCFSDKDTISNFASDCKFIYRYNQPNPNFLITGVKPTDFRKYYLHIYCNDSDPGFTATDNCANAPNLANNYGTINFKLQYTLPTPTTATLPVQVLHNDKVCGDGIVSIGEDCDIGTSCPGSLTCNPTTCQCTAAGKTIISPNWADRSWHAITSANPADSIGLTSQLFNFLNSETPADFNFSINKKDSAISIYSLPGNAYSYSSTYQRINTSIFSFSTILNKANAKNIAVFLGDKFHFNINYQNGVASGASNELTLDCIQGPTPQMCREFGNQYDCESKCSLPMDSSTTQIQCINTLPSGKIKFNREKSYCSWDGTSCSIAHTEYKNANIKGICTYTYGSQSPCDANRRATIAYTGVFSAVGNSSAISCPCASGTIPIYCGQGSMLPFFTPLNFLITGVSIILIYLARRCQLKK